MITVITLFVLVCCIASWRSAGPLRAFFIAWLVCLTPVASGIVRYDYLFFADNYYLWVIAVSILAFAGGAALARAFTPKRNRVGNPQTDWDKEFVRWRPFARSCLIIAAIANTMMLFNYLTVSNLSLDDLRLEVVDSGGARLSQQIAAITVWACFVCLSFGLYFRHKLSRFEFVLYVLMSVGIFLASLASAGRQSVLQIILFLVFLEALRRRQMPDLAVAGGQWLTRGALVVSALAILFFVTVNRSALDTPQAKADIFLLFFNAELAGWFEDLIAPFGITVRDLVTELLLYVSSSVPLFSVLSEIEFGGQFYGVFTFPFLMRQIEPLTGISVINSLGMRNDLLGSAQVIGTGWTTAPSHLVLDFGVIGMAIFLFLQGAVSEWSWIGARERANFGMTLICVILAICAVYMPFLPAIADTNIFLLTLALLVWMLFNRVGRDGFARVVTSPRLNS